MLNKQSVVYTINSSSTLTNKGRVKKNSSFWGHQKKKEEKVERQTDFFSSRHPQKSPFFPTKNVLENVREKEPQLPTTMTFSFLRRNLNYNVEQQKQKSHLKDLSNKKN